jgi:transposase-like protein
MPAERTTMRHVREVLRFKFVGGVPTREIARRIGVAASTVRATLKRFQTSGLSWPLPEEMTDAAPAPRRPQQPSQPTTWTIYKIAPNRRGPRGRSDQQTRGWQESRPRIQAARNEAAVVRRH